MDYTDFEPIIIRLAKQYKYKYHIVPLEWEDIAQELRIHLWKNGHKFDPAKSKQRTFFYNICFNKLKNLSRHYHCQKRRPEGGVMSLNALIEEGQEFEENQSIPKGV